jgi:isoleucyl-tRNA synthetase
MFNLDPAKKSFPELEEEVLKSWQENDTFKKSMERRSKDDLFTFYDGPPFATGLPHYGHILAGAIKDVVPRYQTMKGKYVPRRFGWDCHGLPVEYEMEKELGLSGRKDIEEMGIKEFCESCRGIVLRYTEEWRKSVARMGRWVDMDDDYKTMNADYMESILWVFKSLWEKGLVFESHKPMHICPRCATTLSNFEVSQGYRDVDDVSVVAKFRLIDEPDTSILAWTTTPWTLPSNLLLAVGEDIDYVKFCFTKIEGEPNVSKRKKPEEKAMVVNSDQKYIMAKELFEKNYKNKGAFCVLEQLKGKDLVGKKYQPLYDGATKKFTENENPGFYLVTFNVENSINIFSSPDLVLKCANLFKEVIKDHDYKIYELSIMPDHVHLLLEVEERGHSLQKIIQNLKGISSNKLKPDLTHQLTGGLNHGLSTKVDPRSQKQFIKLWRKGYDKKFIYDEESFQNVQEYIRNNPVKKDLPKQKYPWLSKIEKRKGDSNFLKIHEVVAANFVSTEDGTGIVHIAPAFGEDDLKLGKKVGAPFYQPLDINGTFTDDAPEFLQGKGARESNKEIIKDLKERDLVFESKNYRHSYPHCWRCDSALLNYATSSFFVEVTKIKDNLLKTNQEVHWVPDHLKDGRFGKWLEGARDWAISRNRFWGAPIPIWKCDECDHTEVIGSIREMAEKAVKTDKLFIMRHGEGDHNAKEIVSSSLEPTYSLTEKGKQEVKKAAARLKDQQIDLVFVSPLTRAQETAEIVLENLKSSPEVITESRIAEIDCGNLEGKSISQWRKRFDKDSDRYRDNPHKGESSAMVQKRVTEFLNEVQKKYPGKNILLVTHGIVLNRCLHYFYGVPNEKLAKSLSKTGEVLEFSFSARPQNDQGEIDLHRPYIDEVKLECKCGGEMTRVTDVLDCWFESGSMPYAQLHFPFENSEEEFSFDEASTKKTIERCLQLRTKVFTEEQEIDQEIDQDGQDFDKSTKHFFALKDNKIYATVRTREIEKGIWKIERMAVFKSERSKGLGKKLIDFVANLANRKYQIEKFVTNAQTQAQKFWEKCGFEPIGEVFIEADIEHIKMENQLK